VTDLESRYAAAEQGLEAQRRRSIARGPVGLIAVLVVLALAVGVVAAVDLRRLQTPRGTALAWTGAAVFGDCTAYDRLSVAEPGRPERRSDAEVCAALRRATQTTREQAARTGIDVLAVRPAGREAVVRVEVRSPDGTAQVDLPLVRRGRGWAVVRTDEVCDAVGCP
jgi:hypothetical protein